MATTTETIHMPPQVAAVGVEAEVRMRDLPVVESLAKRL